MVDGYLHLMRMMFNEERTKEEALNLLVSSKFKRDENGELYCG